jgi:FkbM family methyltransferase
MVKAIKRRFIKFISKFYDPLINLNIGTQTILIPLSHQLREIVKIYPEYNFNLPRIVKYISDQFPDIKVIDIGANIGDTVAYIKNFSDVPILCIDGEEKYMKVLKKNISKYNNVSPCQSLVGGENVNVTLKLKSEKGTAHLEEGGMPTTMRTLENILHDFPQFNNSKIIKTDTDGFDTIILRSCKDYLKTVKPVLFFEFDPHLIKKNNDDAFDFIKFLEDCGYYYFIFYTNIGDYMVSCNAEQKDTINELIHYFSGRNLDLFADVCAFTADDRDIFELCKNKEIEHFRKIRRY